MQKKTLAEGCGKKRQAEVVYRFLRTKEEGGFKLGQLYPMTYLGDAIGMEHWSYCGEVDDSPHDWQILCERCCKKHGVLW